jgi:hypothetical protein
MASAVLGLPEVHQLVLSFAILDSPRRCASLGIELCQSSAAVAILSALMEKTRSWSVGFS